MCRVPVWGCFASQRSVLDKVRKQMVTSPLHLQRYLNEVFDPEGDETIDNLYRCYYWMAFSGIREEDTLSITASDVDFMDMSIRYGENCVPLYRESLPAFHNAVELPGFLYKHPNYAKEIRRDRVPGDTIMRGVRATTKTMSIRSMLSHRSAAALQDGKTKQQLSFYRVWMSGLFYRMYERERAGIPVDFSDAAVDFMSGGHMLSKAGSSWSTNKTKLKKTIWKTTSVGSWLS